MRASRRLVLWGSPVRFLRDALRARTLGADAGYDAAVDGLRETPRAVCGPG